MGEVNAQLLTQEISTLDSRQLEEVMHFVGYLKSIKTSNNPNNKSEQERQAAIKSALLALQSAGTFSDIDDPVEWQRSVRTDRPLPGRAS